MLREYIRPWKLFTLVTGIVLLVFGSFYFDAPDWDIPISLIMALLAYLAAPWSLWVIFEQKWKLWPAMLFATWFTVDGSYAIYWHFKNPATLEMMRGTNIFATLALYVLSGLLWYFRGSLMQLLTELKNYLSERP